MNKRVKRTMNLVDENHKCAQEQSQHEEVTLQSLSKQRSCIGKISGRSIGANNKNHPIILRSNPCYLILRIIKILSVTMIFGIIRKQIICVQIWHTKRHDDPFFCGVDIDIAFFDTLLEVGKFGGATRQRVVVTKFLTFFVL